MAARKVQLKDKSGNKAYPVTSSACVGMSDGSGNLDEKLTELFYAVSMLNNNISKLFNRNRKYIVRQSGVVSTANTDNYISTEYIPIEFLKGVVISGIYDNTTSASVGFYNSEKDALGVHIFEEVGKHDIIFDDIISEHVDAKYVVVCDTNSGKEVTIITSNGELYKTISKLSNMLSEQNKAISNIENRVNSIDEEINTIDTIIKGTDVELYNEYGAYTNSTNSAYHFIQPIENVNEKTLTKIRLHVRLIRDTLRIGLATIDTEVPQLNSKINVYWYIDFPIVGESEAKDVEINLDTFAKCTPNSYLYVHGAVGGNISSLSFYNIEGKKFYRYSSLIGTGFTELDGRQLMISLQFGVEGINNELTSLRSDVDKLKDVGLKSIASITYVVDKNGRGDFTTIQSAIDAAQDGDIIYVMPGEYEENIDMGTKIISMIGQSPHNTIVFSSVGTYAEPPLECCHGLIEGIQFYAKRNEDQSYSGVSYAWHLDQRWGNDDSKKQVMARHCIFRTEFPAACIGAGVNNKCIIVLEDCEVYQDYDDSTKRQALQVHGDDSAEHESTIILKNTKLIGKNEGGMLISGGVSKINLNANNVYCTGFYENIGSAFVKGKYNFGNNLSELNS